MDTSLRNHAVVNDAEEDDEQNWEDWNDDGEGELDSDMLCLFCDSRFNTSQALFKHCSSSHYFDFPSLRATLGLDFYGLFKLINYVRSQVAANKCWNCGAICDSSQDLHVHLHNNVFFLEQSLLPWDDDKYLKPFLQEDALLYSFYEDDEHEDSFTISAEEEELISKIGSFDIFVDDDDNTDYLPDNNMGREKSSEKSKTHGGDHMIISSAKVAESKIQNTNKNYFGSYSSFGIHREMLSDKVRTDAYRKAIVENPSLMKGATVLDVGCGTGILSLFAAQAGASRVIAVEASEKMAAVATQIAKDNGHLRNLTSKEGSYNDNEGNGVIEVANGMVEEIVESKKYIEPLSVDVLVSEWMGYCLLYESMLDSVIIARDTWLKPGGAILPDTATMFVAGFGKGATSIPFWENVYGFSMKSVGKELVKDAANAPIIDVIDSKDIITNSAVLQMFDLATMKPEEVEFTSSIALELKSTYGPSKSTESKIDYCYGVVLWFDTSFTSRFCKEAPTVLSTSPYTPKTHWSQTLLTLRDPVAMTAGQNDDGNFVNCRGGDVGTDKCPAMRIDLRISISRAPQHRSIDISLELTAVSVDGQRRKWPVQIYNLY